MNGKNMKGNIPEKTNVNAGRLAIGSLLILMLLGVMIFSLAAATTEKPRSIFTLPKKHRGVILSSTI